MTENLLPCPFCGGESLLRDRYINGVANTKHYIRECRHCKATFANWYRSIKKANEAWNRRAGKDTNVPTNADRIRSMSDEELHKFLLDFEAGDIDYAKTFCSLCCKDAALEQRSTDCDGCLLWWLKNDATLPQGIDWLKQPVKEGYYE